MKNNMKNVYDIKREKGLSFILPLNTRLSTIKKESILIVAHLHYVEKFNECVQYFTDISPEIDIMFSSSNQQIIELLMEYQHRIPAKCTILKKENRGRDISSLLVACREHILKYQYVCFVHDKKEKYKIMADDVSDFMRNLWENTLGSGYYVENVIDTFQKNPSLGVLLPPEPIGDTIPFRNTWDANFPLMVSLAEKMQLNCDLDIEKKPLSLGTAFWARTDALLKLFHIKWKYEDFDEEPLAEDGTISHAIERSLAYVAHDAGFDTGIVMTDRFAGEYIEKMQDELTAAFCMLKSALHIERVKTLKEELCIWQEMVEFADRFDNVYIYGAGEYGQRCAGLLGALLIRVKGFMVSKRNDKTAGNGRIPVYEISEIELDDRTGIIVAVSEAYRSEITELLKLKDHSFKNIFYFL